MHYGLRPTASHNRLGDLQILILTPQRNPLSRIEDPKSSPQNPISAPRTQLPSILICRKLLRSASIEHVTHRQNLNTSQFAQKNKICQPKSFRTQGHNSNTDYRPCAETFQDRFAKPAAFKPPREGAHVVVQMPFTALLCPDLAPGPQPSNPIAQGSEP